MLNLKHKVYDVQALKGKMHYKKNLYFQKCKSFGV